VARTADAKLSSQHYGSSGFELQLTMSFAVETSPELKHGSGNAYSGSGHEYFPDMFFAFVFVFINYTSTHKALYLQM
jgi:hypothetical protein